MENVIHDDIVFFLKISPNEEGEEKQDKAAVFGREGKKGGVLGGNLGRSRKTLAEEVLFGSGESSFREKMVKHRQERRNFPSETFP